MNSRPFWVWLLARMNEKQSQVAIASLISGIAVALASAKIVPEWAAPLLPLGAHALQNIFTPDAVSHDTAQPVAPVLPAPTTLVVTAGDVVTHEG